MINATCIYVGCIYLFFYASLDSMALLLKIKARQHREQHKVNTNSGRGLIQTWHSPGSQLIASFAKLCANTLQALGIEIILLQIKCSFNNVWVSLSSIPQVARSMDDDWRAFWSAVESTSTCTREMPWSVAAYNAWAHAATKSRHWLRWFGIFFIIFFWIFSLFSTSKSNYSSL